MTTTLFTAPRRRRTSRMPLRMSLGAGLVLVLAAPGVARAQGGDDADATNNPALALQWAREQGDYPSEPATKGLSSRDIITYPADLKRPARLLLTQYLPPVRDKGLKKTSTAWAVAYYCYTYAVARQLGLSPEQAQTLKFQFSPAFLNASQDTQKEAMTVSKAFSILEDEGCASLIEWPASDKAFSQKPDQIAMGRAELYRARKTFELFKGGSKNEAADLSQIKSYLNYFQWPMVMAFPIWSDFPGRDEAVSPNAVYDVGKTAKGAVKPSRKNFLGTAVVAVVGYDESKKAFRIVNSWGDKWGDKGFLWVSENFVKNWAHDGWGIGRAGGPSDRAPLADRAVVVGINQYPGLRNAVLRGARNDAQAMAGTLREYGFDVTLLLDDKATRSSILNAVRKAPSQGQENGRLVVYFAGHGTQNKAGASVLLPSDAREGSEDNDLGTSELNAALLSVPARSRTVLLDSCSSGGMLESSKSLQSKSLQADSVQVLGTRFYRRGNVRASRVAPAMNMDTNADLSAGSGDQICYFTAARGNQQASEMLVDGQAHGAFTFSLLRRLSGAKTRWGELQSKVSDDVRTAIEGDLQQPTVSPSFRNALIFDEKPGGGALFSWDDFNADNVDTSKVQMRITPNKTSFKVGETVTLATKIGPKGYLLIVNRGSSGKVSLLFPESRRVQDALVQGNVSVPGQGFVFRLKKPTGTERVKALLLFRRDKAAALLGAFNAGNTLSMKDIQSRLESKDMEKVAAPTPDADAASVASEVASAGGSAEAFYTSDVIFEIVDGEPGADAG